MLTARRAGLAYLLQRRQKSIRWCIPMMPFAKVYISAIKISALVLELCEQRRDVHKVELNTGNFRTNAGSIKSSACEL